MTTAIGTNFEFERLFVMIAGRDDWFYGNARVLGDRRTWWINSIDLYLDPPAESPSKKARVRPIRLKAGTELFETIRFALHRQCTDQIDERMNRAVDEQGGYAALFGEAKPRNPFDHGFSRLNAPSRVLELAA